jgi:hypothetical protein
MILLPVLAVSLLASTAPSETPPVAGEVCVLSGSRTFECRSTSGRRFDVPRRNASSFVWHDRAWTELAFGALAPAQVNVDLESRDWRAHATALRTTGDVAPEAATLTFHGADAALTTKAMASVRRLWLPRATGELLLSAAHHHEASRTITAETEGVGTLTLQPLPSLRGVVVNADDNMPRADAAVVLPSGETAAVAQLDGRFRAWIEADWPAYVRVSAPGRATLQVPVPKIVADADLGTIKLGPGGTLHVHWSYDAPLDLRVLRRASRTWTEVAARTRVSNVTDVANLEPGEYAVLARGAGPLQRIAIETTVRDGQTTDVDVPIDPAELSVSVHGQEPGQFIVIELGPTSQSWQTSITTDGDGLYRGELWQRGDYFAFISAGETTVTRRTTLEGAQRVEWNIDLPHATLDGMVVDDAGQPIEGADVTLDTDTGNGSSTQRGATTDVAGHFAFRAVSPGTQTITATAAAHLPASTSLLFGSGVEHESVTLRMRAGVERTLQIVDANGAPAADATVVDDSGFENERHADANGMVTFTVGAGEQKTLYVLPRGGSLAIVDVNGDTKATGPLRVVVPPGVAAIRVAAATTNGTPMTNVAFALRVGGRMLSPMIRAVLANRSGWPTRTGDDGSALLVGLPAAVYELWPYFSGDELRGILAGTVAPEARIVAQPGLNQVAFRFERP